MPLKLLIVDDSVTIHKVVDLAFEDEDVHVFTAGDGQEALEKINEVLPDIIIADSDMPKINGFELCQKIKGDEKLKEIPLCLLHSDFEEFDEEKFHSCGADDHLSKPFKSEDIINKVAKMTGETGKKEKQDNTVGENLTDNTDEIQKTEKPPEDLDDLEILPFDTAGEDIEESDLIELKPENEISEPNQDTESSLGETTDQEPSEDEIAKFMEEIDSWDENDLVKKDENKKSTESVKSAPAENAKETKNDLFNELDEFDKVLNIPEEEMGTAEPFIEDKPLSNEVDVKKEIKTAIPEKKEQVNIEEKEGTPPKGSFSETEELHPSTEKKSSDLEPTLGEIEETGETSGNNNILPEEPQAKVEDKSQVYSKEEEEEKSPVEEIKEAPRKEPIAEADDTHIPHHEAKTPELESVHGKIEEKQDISADTKTMANNISENIKAEKIPPIEVSTKAKLLKEGDFEKLIGSFIKQAIEKTIKETIQDEISGISGKIIKAVEDVARDNTFEIARQVIQSEIQKLKDSKA